MNATDAREVIVIGGAAAGYTAALYAARANMNPLVIEGVSWGGQLMITSDVENYPGYPGGILGPEMMQDFRKQAERFGAEFITDDVTKVDFSERPFRVWVGDDEYRAETVIVATGANARQLGLPSERSLQGRGVSYCAVCDAAFFRERPVVVVGGGDSCDGGSDVPGEVRVQGDCRPQTRRVPRLAHHGRPRLARPRRSSSSSTPSSRRSSATTSSPPWSCET